ncbi:MAG: DNA replication/repair protein RecF [Lachnospiraceae bacterium]|nr:DNA replication/repair protein RecF [Lachnospiraceae bacterium]
MIIESIQLENFRNYNKLELKLDSGTNLFYGDNAQGKTNILEAVYLCGTTKSHKGSRDREIIKFHQDESHIRMMIQKNSIPYRIDMHLKKNKAKGIAINGVPIRKASDLFGLGNFVFFSPEDLNIIKNGPSERRRFLDMELCQLNRVYLHNLTNYNRILMQRNKLLKDIYFHPEYEDTLDIWDEQMVSYGCLLIQERDRFIEQLNQIIYEIHKKLSGAREELLVSYEKNVSSEAFREELKKGRERDIKLKMSGTGPHRDDLMFQIQNVDIRRFGSQGQQRTAALSLKLSEIELVKKSSRDMPVLLLDDVLSELDGNRQHYLLDSIHEIQTMITCTGIDDFVENNFQIDRLFQVEEGNVSCKSDFSSGEDK